MDIRSRKILNVALKAALPPAYADEEYDDFVNYTPEGQSSFCRVFRIVGAGRMLVVFTYPSAPLSRLSHKDYKLLYLHANGDLVPFDSKALTSNGPGKMEKPWDKTVGAWLAANGAQQFKGVNWVGRFAATLTTLIPLWERSHAPGRPS